MSFMIETPNFTLAATVAGDPDAKKLALLMPGRLETKDYAHLQSHAAHLASLGFYAVAFDPPGTWESPGEILLYTRSYMNATSELITHFNRPTLLVGHSMGGSTAIAVAVGNNRVEGFVAIMSAVTSGSYGPEEEVVVDAWTVNRDMPPGDGPGLPQKTFALPRRVLKGSDLVPNILEPLREYKKPKLFVAGTYDDSEQNKEVHLGYEVSAEPKRFFELHSGHGYRYDAAAIEALNAELSAFIAEFNL